MDRAALWTAEELCAATAGTLIGKASKAINGVSIDSRSVAAGDLFVAIKGDKMDGHDFVEAALKAGAGLALVSRATESMKAAGPLLVVPHDPLVALEAVARAARGRSHGKVIAVTGSVGKTSTKEMLRVAFSANGETHASVASFNNHWGVPLTLSRFSKQAAFGVFEIGMNHSGEITPLVDMVRPHVAIITNVAGVHLSNFPNVEAIADAKAEIFSGVVPGGHAIINRDSPYFDQLRTSARAQGISNIVSFGKHAEADVRLERMALHPDCVCVTAEILGTPVIYKLGLPGEHMAFNSLATLAAVKLAGGDMARAALALAEARPPSGRGAQTRLAVPGGELRLVDESYNANPVSVSAALALLAQAKLGQGGRRIAVLGDMLELGEQGPVMHRDISKAIEQHGIDQVFAAGPLMRHLWDALPQSRRGGYAASSSDLADSLLANLRAGDIVMIKGSNGSRMGLLAEAMKKRWPAPEKDT